MHQVQMQFAINFTAVPTGVPLDEFNDKVQTAARQALAAALQPVFEALNLGSYTVAADFQPTPLESPNIGTPKTAYIQARVPDGMEHFGEAPHFAQVIIDNKLIHKLTSLQRLCVESDLLQIRVYDGPSWAPTPAGLRMDQPELVVTSLGFYFAAEFPDRTFRIETDYQYIDDFLAASRDEPGPLFLSSTPEVLQALVEETGASLEDDAVDTPSP